MTPTTGMLDKQQAVIDAVKDSLTQAEDSGNPSPSAQELLDQAQAKLDAAQEALDEARAALEDEPPNEELARTKLAESVERTIEALDLIKRALETE